jgi:hypothetical protein
MIKRSTTYVSGLLRGVGLFSCRVIDHQSERATMPRSNMKKMSLPAASVEALAAELAALSRRSFHGHAKLVGRLAVSYRPCSRTTAALSEVRVPFDDFHLFALSHRWVDNRGIVTPMIVMGMYRPALDLPGSGRIAFECETALVVGRWRGRPAPDPRVNLSASRTAMLLAQAVEDVDQVDLLPGVQLPRFYWGFDNKRPPRPEPAVAAAHWAAAEVRIGDLRAWPAEFFARPIGTRYNVHPLDGSNDPFGDELGPAEEGTTRGSWILRDGVATPRAQQPVAVYADLAHLASGRSIRNPSWRVLERHDLLPHKTSGYRHFLEKFSPFTGLGRLAPDPGDSTRAAGQFRAAMAAYIDAEAGRADALIGAVRDACLAAGVPIPVDEERAYEFLVGLLENPWLPAEVPAAVAGIQTIGLIGMPDPNSMTYSTGTVRANLYDLGEHAAARFEQIPARRVDEAFRQRYGRKRSPIAMI